MAWFSQSKDKQAKRAADDGPREGAVIGSYRLERPLGSGAMGVVWLAKHTSLQTPCALKLIRPEQARSSEVVARFELEAKSAASLKSPHIAQVWDFGPTHFGGYYYASEYIDGLDLQQLVLEHGPLPQERAVYLAEQVCDSLSAAHDGGVIHRDLKPGNIVVERGVDVAKVVDFGLVRAIGCDRDEVTTPDRLAGTPGYLAPEVVVSECRGECDVDGRADLYALACVLYWLLTARLVFEAKTPVAQAAAHAVAVPLPPSARAPGQVIDAALERVILQCLEKAPEDRPKNARELRALLQSTGVARRWSPELASEWWNNSAPRRAS